MGVGIMDPFSALIGLLLGTALTMVALEYLFYRSRDNVITPDWNLVEERSLKICTTQMGAVPIPEDVKILVQRGTKLPGEIVRKAIVRETDNVYMNFAVSEDRAYIFMGPIEKNVRAFITTDEQVIEDLNDIFDKLWKSSERQFYDMEKIERLEEYIDSPIKVRGRILSPELLLKDLEARLVLPDGRVIMVHASPRLNVDETQVYGLHGANVEIQGILRLIRGSLSIEAISIRRI